MLPLALRLVQEGVLDLNAAVERLTAGPARAANLPFGHLAPGAWADICIFDPQRHWHFSSAGMTSWGRNTPFDGWDFTGRVTHTLFEGRLVFKLGDENNG